MTPLLLLLLMLFLSKRGGTLPSALAFRVSASFKSNPMTMHKMQQPTASSSSSSFRLGYVTDVEGNLEYFKSFVRQSQVLDLVENDDEDDTTIELALRDDGDDCYFVYGGDAVDKGPGDIRLCRALVQLKRRHPDRVVLLVGNRDLNKLRLAAELSDADVLERSLDDIARPHWDPEAPTLRQYLESILQKEGKFCNFITVEQLNTRVNRLHCILLHTLGCPHTFEFRRQELAILASRTASPEDITDDEVVQSFLDEIQEGGSLLEYLQQGQVAAVIGNTLFVHGAVDVNTMQFVPSNDSKFENPKSKPAPGKICHDLQEWVVELNDYLKHGLDDYKKRPYWDEARTTRGGESLMALQNRPAMWGRSIVSNCYGDGGCITTLNAMNIRNDPQRSQQEAVHNNPLVFENVSSDPLDDTVASWLLEHGIRRVVVGHKPTGDCPAVLSSRYTGAEIVSADTSFSDTTADDNRGQAVAVVEIVGGSSTDNHLELCGTFQDGTNYRCHFTRLHIINNNTVGANAASVDEFDEGDANLGTQLQDGWWIKARTSDDYQLCRGQGRRVEYKTVPIQELSRYQS
jgi:hypothetical protein